MLCINIILDVVGAARTAAHIVPVPPYPALKSSAGVFFLLAFLVIPIKVIRWLRHQQAQRNPNKRAELGDVGKAISDTNTARTSWRPHAEFSKVWQHKGPPSWDPGSTPRHGTLQEELEWGSQGSGKYDCMTFKNAPWWRNTELLSTDFYISHEPNCGANPVTFYHSISTCLKTRKTEIPWPLHLPTESSPTGLQNRNPFQERAFKMTLSTLPFQMIKMSPAKYLFKKQEM